MITNVLRDARRFYFTVLIAVAYVKRLGGLDALPIHSAWEFAKASLAWAEECENCPVDAWSDMRWEDALAVADEDISNWDH